MSWLPLLATTIFFWAFSRPCQCFPRSPTNAMRTATVPMRALSGRLAIASSQRVFLQHRPWQALPSLIHLPLQSLQSTRWRSNFARRSSENTRQADSPRPKKAHNSKDFPFPYHTELELVIEDLTNLGLGVARVALEDGKKWVVMVPMVLPGERVRARVFRNHDSYSEADLLAVLSPSPDRVTPQCRFFSVCGGCQYQHMNISSQRAWKRSQVESLLQRIGGIDKDALSVRPVVGTDHLYHYRSKITPHHQAPHPEKPLKVGFQMRSSNVIVDIDECPIASLAINEKYAKARAALFELDAEIKKNGSLPSKGRQRGATLLFREADEGYVATDNREIISETVGEIQFRFKAGEFFQNNPHVVPLLVNHVLHQASQSDPPCRFLVDAYCGSGLFALSAAQRFESVYGVEVSDLAVKAAKENAKLNGIANAEFLCGSSEAIFEKIIHLPPSQTAVIIDPPRKGCDMVFLTQLFQFKPARVVYVSCDPATQARDTKHFLENGYEIVDITPFDLFPQTRHIENVISFRLKDSPQVKR